jgi:amidase
MADYLSTQVVNSTVLSLFDIINFNDANAALEFPLNLPDQFGQNTIVGAAIMPDRNTSADYWFAQYDIQRLYVEQILPVYEQHALDLLVMPGDTDSTRLGTIGQQPVGGVPNSQRKNGAPYGLTFTGRRYDEATVIKAMSGWEAVHNGARPIPSTLD